MAASNYWKKREEENLRKNLKTEAEYAKEIERIYKGMMDDIQKDIDAFYGRYASKEGISISEAKKRVSKLDIEEYGRKAKRYVKEKNFSKQANEEMRLYNLTMKVNRLELLKAQIGLELVSGFDELQQYFEQILTERTLEEFKRQAGILGDTVSDTAAATSASVIAGASFYNATFSDRIWVHQDLLKAELAKLLRTGLIQGRNPRELARQLRKVFNTSKYNAERLMRTEMARVQVEAQRQSYERNGFEQYKYIACHDMKACEICKALDGKVFDVSEMAPGENAPPLHPNCRCSTAAHIDDKEYEDWLSRYKEHGMSFREWRETRKKGLKANNSEMDGKVPKPLKLGTLKDVSEKNIRKVLYAWEKKLVGQEFESAIVITKTGDVFKIDGDTNSVNINGLSREQLRGAWMTHNHPASETYYSFSAFDISEALRNRFSLLRGTDVAYNYEYRTTENTKPGEFDKIFNLFGETYRNKAYEAALNGNIDIDMDEYDFICKMLAKDYDFYYERKKK